MNDLTTLRPPVVSDRHLYGSFMPRTTTLGKLLFVERAEAIAAYVRSCQPVRVCPSLPGHVQFSYSGRAMTTVIRRAA